MYIVVFFCFLVVSFCFLVVVFFCFLVVFFVLFFLMLHANSSILNNRHEEMVGAGETQGGTTLSELAMTISTGI